MSWKLAQILEVRYEVPYDDDAVFWDPPAEEDVTMAAAAGGDAANQTAKDAQSDA